jgi:hypothetical protein
VTVRKERTNCGICAASLDGRRADARFCSGACRAEASRLRRILSGEGADGYATLADRQAAAQKRTRAPVERVDSAATTEKWGGAAQTARPVAPKG